MNMHEAREEARRYVAQADLLGLLGLAILWAIVTSFGPGCACTGAKAPAKTGGRGANDRAACRGVRPDHATVVVPLSAGEFPTSARHADRPAETRDFFLDLLGFEGGDGHGLGRDRGVADQPPGPR